MAEPLLAHLAIPLDRLTVPLAIKSEELQTLKFRECLGERML